MQRFQAATYTDNGLAETQGRLGIHTWRVQQQADDLGQGGGVPQCFHHRLANSVYHCLTEAVLEQQLHHLSQRV
jgi:hypothetical protein